jgi:16S rRNA (adenine1518-N6/adenine1519-N6)-dimethyltransferase
MLTARKRLGQHFLEPAWVRKLLDVIAPQPADVFLEIGPGRGALTLPLAARTAAVVAVEIDRDLAADLGATVPPNVRIATADVLAADLFSLLADAPRPVRVAGNLPYNISSPILFRLLAFAGDGRFFSDATLMLQREVADRLAAPPGTRDYGVLAILARRHADIVRALVLPPGAFRPPPKVTSAVVRLTFRAPAATVRDPAVFEQMVRQIFTQRRKRLGNALKTFADRHGVSAAEATAKAGIDPGRRPETLNDAELAVLSDVFASAARPDVL